MDFQFLSSYMRSIYTMKWPSTTIVWLSLLESGEKVKFVENSFIKLNLQFFSVKMNLSAMLLDYPHCEKLTWKWGGQKQLMPVEFFYRVEVNCCFIQTFILPYVWTTVQMPFSNGKNDQIQKGEIQKKFSFSDAGMAGGCNWLFQMVAYCTLQTSY